MFADELDREAERIWNLDHSHNHLTSRFNEMEPIDAHEERLASYRVIGKYRRNGLREKSEERKRKETKH